MRTNNEGLCLIETFKDEYDPAESKTASEKAINLFVKVRLTSNQFSALVSLVMHIGIDSFRRSNLLKLINASAKDWRKFVKAADEFHTYIYIDDEHGKRVADDFLIQHRDFEKALFLKPEQIRKRKEPKRGRHINKS